MINFAKYKISRELSGDIALAALCLILMLFSFWLFLNLPFIITIFFSDAGTINSEWAVVGLVSIIAVALFGIVM